MAEFTFTTTSLGSSIAPPVRLLELQSIPLLMRRLESGHWDGPMLEQICRLGRGAEGLTEMLRHQAALRALVGHSARGEKPAHAAMVVQALRNFLACPLNAARRQPFVWQLLQMDTVPFLVQYLEERRDETSVREWTIALSAMAYFLKGLDQAACEALACARQLVAQEVVPVLIGVLGLEEMPAKAAARVLHSLAKVDRGETLETLSTARADGPIQALLTLVTARGESWRAHAQLLRPQC